MSFSLDLKKFADKAGVNVDTVIKSVAEDILTSVVFLSPVDKGTFATNWNVSINSRNTSTTESTAQDAVARGLPTILSFTSGSINITNALPYAARLENGYSQKQAPQGMVGITVVEWKTHIKKAIRELK